MGLKFFDQYSYLHFAVGIITYYWGINLKVALIVHTIFELSENTKMGMNFINNILTFWPGGKPKRDSNINILGDTIFFIFGWMSAKFLDDYGTKNNWYFKHLTDI